MKRSEDLRKLGWSSMEMSCYRLGWYEGAADALKKVLLLLAVQLLIVLVANANADTIPTATAATVAGAATATPPPPPPNIVLVLLDDASKLDWQIMPSFSPNIQARIVASGVRFDNAFATQALCTPSRCSLLTGRYPHNHHVLGNEPPIGGASLFTDADTLATRLQAAGYRTVLVGKYLNGYGKAPMAQTYVPPGWDDWHGLIDATLTVYNSTMNSNGVVGTIADYQTVALGEIAAASVVSGLGSGKPQFLYLALTAPHVEDWTILKAAADGWQEDEDPWRLYARPDPRDQTGPKAAAWAYIANILPSFYRGPAFNEADVSDKPAFLQTPSLDAKDVGLTEMQFRTRLLCQLPVDDVVGKVAAALGTAQLANTIWILASDHGYMIGDHRKAAKQLAYEPSIRIPLMISGPGVVGHVESSIALLQDLYPTVLEMAGAQADESADGRSLMPLLTTTAWGASWGRKRFLVTNTQTVAGAAPDVPTFAAVRTGPLDSYPQRVWVEWLAGPFAIEHYALATDPFELTNGAAGVADAEIAALRSYSERLRACAGAVGPTACREVEGF